MTVLTLPRPNPTVRVTCPEPAIFSGIVVTLPFGAAIRTVASEPRSRGGRSSVIRSLAFAATLAPGDAPPFVDQLRSCGCNGADLAAVSALIAYDQAEGGANLHHVDLPRTRPTGAAARQTAAEFVTASNAPPAAAPAAP